MADVYNYMEVYCANAVIVLWIILQAITVIENGLEGNIEALNVGDEPVRVLAMCHNNVGNSYRQLRNFNKAEVGRIVIIV